MRNNIFYTHSFNEIFDTELTFKSAYDTYMQSFLTTDKLDDGYVSILFNLMQARHGYDRVSTKPFIGFDKTTEEILEASDAQFKREFFAICAMYGKTWEKKYYIQSQLRNLTPEEIFGGAKQIINTANNPSTTPSTDDIDELEYVDNQTTTNYVKSKMEGYNILWDSLHSNPTEDFLRKFDKLFKPIINPWYNYSGDEEDEG